MPNILLFSSVTTKDCNFVSIIFLRADEILSFERIVIGDVFITSNALVLLRSFFVNNILLRSPSVINPEVCPLPLTIIKTSSVSILFYKNNLDPKTKGTRHVAT